jgi:hypothetical protein
MNDCKCGKSTCPRSPTACDHCYCEQGAAVCCQCGEESPFTFKHPWTMPYWRPDWSYRPPVWPGNTWEYGNQTITSPFAPGTLKVT